MVGLAVMIGLYELAPTNVQTSLRIGMLPIGYMLGVLLQTGELTGDDR